MLNQKHESTGTDLIAWLTCVIPGWLVEGNIDAMAFAIRNLPPDSAIVEIGSFCGLSTCVISYLKRRYGKQAPFCTCDPWTFESLLCLADDDPFFDEPYLTYGDFKAYVRECFVRNVLTFCQPEDFPHSFVISSDDFFSRWQKNEEATELLGHSFQLGGQIGFCHIDGNHTLAFVERDFRNADKVLAPGGFILFDDSREGTEYPDVREVAEEALRSGYEKISANPNYLLRKR